MKQMEPASLVYLTKLIRQPRLRMTITMLFGCNKPFALHGFHLALNVKYTPPKGSSRVLGYCFDVCRDILIQPEPLPHQDDRPLHEHLRKAGLCVSTRSSTQ